MEKRLFLGLLFLSIGGLSGLVKGGEEDTTKARWSHIEEALIKGDKKLQRLDLKQANCKGRRAVVDELSYIVDELSYIAGTSSEDIIDVAMLFCESAMGEVQIEYGYIDNIEGRIDRNFIGGIVDMSSYYLRNLSSIQRQSDAQTQFSDNLAQAEKMLDERSLKLIKQYEKQSEELDLLATYNKLIGRHSPRREGTTVNREKGFTLRLEKNDSGLFNLLNQKIKRLKGK